MHRKGATPAQKGQPGLIPGPTPAASVSRCRDSEEECTVGGAWPATA
ncbi:hypothetical protein AC239_30850 [Bacteroides fragilis]|nr:hypothetical protein AC239_30850 [Bacteroides fragilis]